MTGPEIAIAAADLAGGPISVSVSQIGTLGSSPAATIILGESA